MGHQKKGFIAGFAAINNIWALENDLLRKMTFDLTALQDVTKEDIEAAVALVNRQDSQDIFKTYGPNNDSMLMTLCCKKDDTPTIRAQVGYRTNYECFFQ